MQVGDCCSTYCDTLLGVPQGGVLSPKLFNVYINDIVNVSATLQFLLFADDTTCYMSGPHLADLVTSMNYELAKLEKWLKLNRLSLNVGKTNFIVFGKNQDFEGAVLFGKMPIKQVLSTKFLGVHIDKDLNWNEHLKVIKCKLSKSIAMLCRAKQFVTTVGLRALYECMFVSHLTYCCVVWGNYYQSKLEPIRILQRKAIRIVYNLNRRCDIKQACILYKVLQLDELVKLATGCLMFNAYKERLPKRLQAAFVRCSVNAHYSVRRERNFRILYVRTTKKSLCFSSTGVRLWNSLPGVLKSSVSYFSFKRAYKKVLLGA